MTHRGTEAQAREHGARYAEYRRRVPMLIPGLRPRVPRLTTGRGGDQSAQLLERVRAPALVLHARDDAVAPLSEGRALAS